MDQELLLYCRALYSELQQGSESALARVQGLREAAKAGDRSSALVFNTLAVLHWQPQQAKRWPSYEAFYKALAQGQAPAWAKVRALKQAADSGDEASLRSFRTLKAVHNKYKVSAWYPGAPSFRGYGMPNTHRAGIEVPGMTAYLPLTPVVTAQILSLITAAMQPALPGPGTDSMSSPPALGPAPGSNPKLDMLRAMASPSPTSALTQRQSARIAAIRKGLGRGASMALKTSFKV